MLIASVVLYLLVTIAIGLWAAMRVKNSKDYVVAGRSLPLYMNTATVFATWFGAESVLSVSVEFSKSGLAGIIADPFGSSVCLVIVALLFARAFYRMDLLTIGDFYRKRYGRAMELGTSVIIAISYLGWTAAQLTALGLVFSTLTNGAVSLETGIVISGVVVLAYTIWGGMWSVAMTDLFQSVMIIVGLGLLVDPSLVSLLSAQDARETQRIMTEFILGHTPMWIQVLFFGALLSAILSTASGAIIAPTSLCTENIIRPLYPNMSDRQFLLTLRVVLVSFTFAALVFALRSKQTMYDMVQNAYTVTLVAALVPLAAGIFWKRAYNAGAILSAVFGLVAWLIAAFIAADAAVPPTLVGLAFSILGMVLGAIVPSAVAQAHRHGASR